MSKVQFSLSDYLMAGYTAIVCRTCEENRIKRLIEQFISNHNEYKLKWWSRAEGFDGNDKKENSNFSPTEVLKDCLKFSSRTIVCLTDFHPYINKADVWSVAKACFNKAQKKQIVYVFISNEFSIPSELEGCGITEYYVSLPTTDEYNKLISKYISKYPQSSDLNTERIVEALSGLTLESAENALSLSLVKSEYKIDLDIINSYKTDEICKSGLLEVYNFEGTIDSVGGMAGFKEYISERGLSVYSDEAREYGLPYPKGVLLFGVPGCGKSLAAKAIANTWKRPLIRFDVGKLYASLVGETESNTRKVLNLIERLAPCVLWIDEIDKALSGTASSGKTDSGVTARLFGTLLTWMNDRQSPVYVIATANSVTLPDEFYRPGRFDEIFFVDLPTFEERIDIFKVLTKKYRCTDDMDFNELAESSENFSGAELEKCITDAMYSAWNDNKRKCRTDDILKKIRTCTPAANGISRDGIATLKTWAKERGIRLASGETTYESNTDNETCDDGVRNICI